MKALTRTAAAAAALALSTPLAAQPPVAKKVPHSWEIHGQKLSDDYAWLRDRKDPDTLPYLKAENRYCDQQMAPTRPLQQQLYQEMLSRMQEDDLKPAYRQGAYGYYSRSKKGKSYPIYCRRPWGKNGPEEILLDVNRLAQGQPYLAVGSFEMSPDSRWLAYSSDNRGYRQYRLQFKNLSTGQLSPETIERVTSVAWAQDSRTFFFTTEDPTTKRSDRFWKHSLGQSSSQLLYVEEDPLFDLVCQASRDRDYVMLHCLSKTSSECRYRPADASSTPLKTLKARQPLHEYWADHFGDRFVIRTNLSAPCFKVCWASNQQPEQWQDWVQFPDSTQIDQFCLFPQHLVLAVRRGGVPGLAILNRGDGQIREVDFPEQVRSLWLGDNEDSQLDRVRVGYESPITPTTTFDVALDSGSVKLVKRQPVPNYQSGRYQCQRWLVPARDGVEVPVTLVYRKGLNPQVGGHPLLLEGYGSYGAIDDPFFSASNFSLLDRGVVYAYAHIRGGGELGEPWRQAGRMERKQTTFNDFVDCAQNLVDHGWARADGLVITGASAGGLLVGAAVNQRPQIFRAVIAKVPFVDVINTMLDASLPLTTSEWIEWGNPHEKSAFDTMLAYSPYDNVRATAYPAMLVKVSLHDSQVPYWEGAKWVAKLRALKTDHNTLLLKSNLSAGHGGSSGRYARLRERAFDYAFALWQMGIHR